MYYTTFRCNLCNFKTTITRSNQKPYDASILLKQQNIDHLNSLIIDIEEEEEE